jgi:hypothetical protein
MPITMFNGGLIGSMQNGTQQNTRKQDFERQYGVQGRPGQIDREWHKKKPPENIRNIPDLIEIGKEMVFRKPLYTEYIRALIYISILIFRYVLIYVMKYKPIKHNMIFKNIGVYNAQNGYTMFKNNLNTTSPKAMAKQLKPNVDPTDANIAVPDMVSGFHERNEIGLDKAYKATNKTYVDGNTMYIAGTDPTNLKLENRVFYKNLFFYNSC